MKTDVDPNDIYKMHVEKDCMIFKYLSWLLGYLLKVLNPKAVGVMCIWDHALDITYHFRFRTRSKIK